MSFIMEDHLESGWVSVRPNIFDEKERHKFAFIVAWNDVEGKFAITCHDRTAQRRSAFLDVDRSPTAALPPPGACVAEKHAKSPAAAKEDGARPRSVPRGKSATSATADKKALKSCEYVSHAFGSWDVVSPRLTDVEILDPADVALSPDDAEPGEGESSGREDFSWARLFSFQDLKAAHLQLCAVNSDLEPCLPPLPEERRGVWSALFGAPGTPRRETDALCYQLQVYLGHALDTCGWKILSRVLFSESDDTEEYYESLSELRQKGYEDAQERARRRLQEVKFSGQVVLL